MLSLYMWIWTDSDVTETICVAGWTEANHSDDHLVHICKSKPWLHMVNQGSHGQEKCQGKSFSGKSGKSQGTLTLVREKQEFAKSQGKSTL